MQKGYQDIVQQSPIKGNYNCIEKIS